MMRSGTSLIEQILASHPLVFGAGERKDFERGLVMRQIEENPRQGGGCPLLLESVYPSQLTSLRGENLRWLGSRYLRVLRELIPGVKSRRIIDKMPLNFRFVGLIHLVFPNARIIHAKRDPVDTCLSAFSKLFVEDHPYTYELRELGRYYRAYAKMMEHWKTVLPPEVMIEVNYEELVLDFKRQALRLVNHLGLDWDESCATFHETKRAVRTASTNQVRQPLYQSSIGRWRPDTVLLQPLLDGLDGL